MDMGSGPQVQNMSDAQRASHFDLSCELSEFQNDALEKIRALDMGLVSEDKWVRRNDAFIRIHKLPRSFRYMPVIGPGICNPALLQEVRFTLLQNTDTGEVTNEVV